jgi:hypothetical protein
LGMVGFSDGAVCCLSIAPGKLRLLQEAAS